MPIFVHLTSERSLAIIRRRGIAVSKRRFGTTGVYAMPVTPDFYLSHQWLRELKRADRGTMAGVYFRLPDDETVHVGRFDQSHTAMTAAKSVAALLAAQGQNTGKATMQPEPNAPSATPHGNALMPPAEGFEVIVPRRIERSEIVRVKSLPQTVGWRYFPQANGKPPRVCLCCERGQYGVRKMLKAVETAEIKGQRPKIIMFGREDDSFARVAHLRRKNISAEKADTAAGGETP